MSEVKCINLTVIAPKEKVEEVEKIFNKHGDWMKSFYADDKEHLLHGYFTKAPEYNNSLDPSSGETGGMIFTINEQFSSMESVMRHEDHAQKNDYFSEFGKIIEQYGKGLSIGGELTYSF